MTTHRIKVDTAYVGHLLVGAKPFEVRKNDRAYRVGDYLLMQEVGDVGVKDGHWVEPGAVDCSRCRERRYVRARITYVYAGDPRWTDLCHGYVVLGLDGIGLSLPIVRTTAPARRPRRPLMPDTPQPADLAGLRALAEAATPGPWAEAQVELERYAVRANYIDSEGRRCTTFVAVCSSPGYVADAAYIAAASPAVVLALIDDLDAARAALPPCDAHCASLNDGPQEDCSRHGRTPRELWDRGDRFAVERDAERARADAAEADLRLATGQGDRYLARVKAAERQVWDVRALHAPEDLYPDAPAVCPECHRAGDPTSFYPCATIRALDSEATP